MLLLLLFPNALILHSWKQSKDKTQVCATSLMLRASESEWDFEVRPRRLFLPFLLSTLSLCLSLSLSLSLSIL